MLVMLGKDAQELTPDIYHKSAEAIGAWCKQYAPRTLGPRGLANLKNNLRWLMDLGVKQKWLLPLVGEVIPWKSQKQLPHGRVKRPLPPDNIPINRSPYRLLLPEKPHVRSITPQCQAFMDRQRQGLQLLPEPVRQDMENYLRWCASDYAPGRPARIKKREVSAKLVRDAVCAIGGYAVHIAGIPLTEVSLRNLTDPVLVEAFVAWWVNERRLRVTRSIIFNLVQLYTLAQYWVKEPLAAKGIQNIIDSLNHAIPAVWDKEASLLSLVSLNGWGSPAIPLMKSG